ncbi:MAG: tetratricopeptide repeat protein [Firmicutes bacterium]|nr:tetratricopeptide repeat protein [Bacillota bacterium]
MNRRMIFIIAAVLVLAAAGIVLAASGTLNLAERQLKLACKLMDEGKYEEAILAFQKVIEIDPRKTEAYAGLSLAYANTGQVDKATDIIKLALVMNLDEIELLHGAMVDIYLIQNNEAGARAYLASIIDEKILAYLKQEYADLFEEKAAGAVPEPTPGVSEEPADSNTEGSKILNFNSEKQLSYAEYTINGIHVSSGFGDPLKTESVNFDGTFTGNRSGEFSETKYYNGFQEEFHGVYASDIGYRFYTITDKSVYGPRNIRVGDSFQEVLKKFPSTVEVKFDPPSYSDAATSKMISSGMAEVKGQQFPSAVMLNTDKAGKKYLDCLIYVQEYNHTYHSATIAFVRDVVSEIRIAP